MDLGLNAFNVCDFISLFFFGVIFCFTFHILCISPLTHFTTVYKRYNSENISIVPFISGRPLMYTSNAHVMRQVAAGSHKTSWVKPEYSSAVFMFVCLSAFYPNTTWYLYRSFSQWGINLFGADGEVWRRHRRIMGPAFHKETYATSFFFVFSQILIPVLTGILKFGMKQSKLTTK